MNLNNRSIIPLQQYVNKSQGIIFPFICTSRQYRQFTYLQIQGHLQIVFFE